MSTPQKEIMANEPPKEEEQKPALEASETAAAPSALAPTEHNQEHDDVYIIDNLLVDSGSSETDTDRDSTLGDEVPQSSTTSLTSSVTTFRDIRGRRYHAFEDSNYWLPNDDEEIGRLDLQHFICKIVLNGRLNLAPISKDLHRAMDVGTGTGKWAIEFADDHPSCQVIGTDLSPIQPNVVPNNCSFVVDNIEEPWVFNEPFDFIHSRMLCLGLKDWPTYFKRCFENLKPGGWVEAHDCKFPIESANPDCPPDQPLWAWSKHMAEAVSKTGIDPDPTPKFRKYMEEAGFINIHEQPCQWPVGSWPKGKREKLIGRLMLDNVKNIVKPAANALFTRFLGWTAEQVDEFIPKVQEDVVGKVGRYYGKVHIVYAQKPEVPS